LPHDQLTIRFSRDIAKQVPINEQRGNRERRKTIDKELKNKMELENKMELAKEEGITKTKKDYRNNWSRRNTGTTELIKHYCGDSESTQLR
jgi:phenylalanine-4-hydroxylase